MQKIIPHLWFDKEAAEAAQFYASIFPKSVVTAKHTIKDTPSGDSEVVEFEIMGYKLMGISAGPAFNLNPSISLMVNFDPLQDEIARERIDEIWEKLLEGGRQLMPLQEYPFSQRYGWVQDKYGFSWQLIYTNPEGDERPLIIPSMLFVGINCGKAEEASEFYISIFKNSLRGSLNRYPAGSEPDKEGTVMFTDFKLEGQWFAAMDSAREHEFNFSEAVSFIINCDDQEEINYFWEKLSAVKEAEQCGWVKDKFGISWQILPRNMNKLLDSDAAVQKMLQMKKIIISDLENI